ncbi:unnamed protein product [Brassica rapa subsp. trilocularis]
MFGVIRRCVQGVSGRRVGRFSLMVARASQCSAAGVSKTTCFGVQLPSAIACLLEALVVVFLTALFAVGKMVGGSGNFVLRVPINRDQP